MMKIILQHADCEKVQSQRETLNYKEQMPTINVLNTVEKISWHNITMSEFSSLYKENRNAGILDRLSLEEVETLMR